MSTRRSQQNIDLAAVSTTSKFFQCPREIRDMIYHYLWKETPCLRVAWHPQEWDPMWTCSWYLVIAALYDMQPKHTESYEGPRFRLPQWLRTNKQMITEGLEQFQNKGVWCVQEPQGFDLITASNKLLHPSTAHNVVVWLKGPEPIYYKGANGFLFTDEFPHGAVRKWVLDEEDCVHRLYEILLANGTSHLKALEFRVALQPHELDPDEYLQPLLDSYGEVIDIQDEAAIGEHPFDPKDWQYQDFSALEAPEEILGTLTKLTMDFADVRCLGDEREKELLQVETVRLGLHMVGSGLKMEVRNFLRYNPHDQYVHRVEFRKA